MVFESFQKLRWFLKLTFYGFWILSKTPVVSKTIFFMVSEIFQKLSKSIFIPRFDVLQLREQLDGKLIQRFHFYCIWNIHCLDFYWNWLNQKAFTKFWILHLRNFLSISLNSISPQTSTGRRNMSGSNYQLSHGCHKSWSLSK